MAKPITFKDFIENNLILETYEIMTQHPYLACSLICSGMEFVGNCVEYVNTSVWDDKHRSCSNNFIVGFKLGNPNYSEPTARRYYHNIRCGLTHLMRIKPSAKVKYLGVDTGFTQTVSTTYKDVVDVDKLFLCLYNSCQVLLSNPKYSILLSEDMLSVGQVKKDNGKNLLLSIRMKSHFFQIESQKALSGNKSAAVRARKLSLELGQLLKQYRQECK